MRYNHFVEEQTGNIHKDSFRLAEELESAGVLRTAPQYKIGAFACACCRLIWNDLPPLAQEALEVGERFVAGTATVDEVRAAYSKLWQDLGDEAYKGYTMKNCAYRAVVGCLYISDVEDDPNGPYANVTYTMEYCNHINRKAGREHYRLMRDTFGIPSTTG